MTAPAIITRWRCLLDTDGHEWHPESWGDVFAWLSTERSFIGTHEHPGWSAARFEPCKRNLDNVRSVYGFALDFDKGETIEVIAERLAAFFGLIQTSRRHAEDAHRFRVLLPLSRPVSKFEYEALWNRFAPFAGNVDPAPKDPSRFWFASGTQEGGTFRTVRLNGAPLDVDEWLAKPDPATPRARVPEPARTRDQAAIEENARRYIAAMPEAISGSGGHNATYEVAIALARGFALGEDATFRILWNDYNPRCQPAWTEKALRRKAQQAQVANRVSLGYLLRDDRPQWTPRRQPVEMPPPDFWDDGRDDTNDFDAPPVEPSSWAHSSPSDDGPVREPDDEVTPVRKSAAERWGAVGMKTMLTEVFMDQQNPRFSRGLTTGIEFLDAQIGGYRRGNITILGAQTSWGKSSLGVMGLEENHKRGERVLVISCEDKRLLYGRRLACRMGGISALRMRDGVLRPDELVKVGLLADEANDEPVFLDAVGMPIEKTARAVRELCKECGFALVVVDYLQRFRSERKNIDRRNEVTLVCGLLSDEIKLANAAGLVFSQMKRIEGGKPPTIEDMKESGDIEIMAEHVALGWRLVERDGVKRRLGVRKNKDGPVDDDWHELDFDERTASFTGRLAGDFGSPDYGTSYDNMGSYS